MIADPMSPRKPNIVLLCVTVAPGRSPGAPRVAAQDTTSGEPGSAHRTVSLHGLQSVGRAGGVVAADLTVQRADGEPVRLQQPDQGVLHRAPARASAASSCSASVAERDAVEPREVPAPRHDCPSGSVPTRSRIRCRSRRLTRLRSTAEPTALLTTKPTDVGPPVPGTHMGDEGWLYAFGPTTDRVPEVIPAAHALTAREQRAQADSLARPLRRRSARIARPARVRMRRRKPCFLARRRLFGWKVRLLTMCSSRESHGSSGPVDGHRSPTTENCGCRGHAAEVVLGRLDNGTGGPDAGQTDPHTRPTRSRPHDTPIAVRRAGEFRLYASPQGC